MSRRQDGNGAQAPSPPQTPCPTCGLLSEEIRCPRCNALKLTACTGACVSCRSRQGCASR